MNFREFLKNNNVILDGGMGTLLQGAGLAAGELPELEALLYEWGIAFERSHLRD